MNTGLALFKALADLGGELFSICSFDLCCFTSFLNDKRARKTVSADTMQYGLVKTQLSGMAVTVIRERQCKAYTQSASCYSGCWLHLEKHKMWDHGDLISFREIRQFLSLDLHWKFIYKIVESVYKQQQEAIVLTVVLPERKLHRGAVWPAQQKQRPSAGKAGTKAPKSAQQSASTIKVSVGKHLSADTA